MFQSSSLESFLQHFICEHAGADKVTVESIKRLGGGAIQENLALDLRISGGEHAGLQQWVLRTDAPTRLPISLSRAEEFAVLQQAYKAGVTVPEPLWLHRDQGQLGQDFYLMRRIDGDAGGRTLVLGNLSQPQRDDVLGQLGHTLGLLHQVRPAREGLEFLKLPPANPALSRIEEYRQLIDELGRPQPVLEWAMRWLELNAPQEVSISLIHGDFRTGNYMVAGDRVTGILDWEFAGWGAADEDIGWFNARCWRFGRLDAPAGGLGSLDAFLAGYERTADRKVDRHAVGYWRAMGALRWAVIALLQAERHISGEQSSLELALTGRMLPEIELDLVDEIAALEQEHCHA